MAPVRHQPERRNKLRRKDLSLRRKSERSALCWPQGKKLLRRLPPAETGTVDRAHNLTTSWVGLEVTRWTVTL